jgi:hypothetical protein
MARLQLRARRHWGPWVSSTALSISVEHRARNVALIDLLDRLLQGGVVIHGDVTLAAADVDLVKLDLRILLAAIDKTLGP